jgi:tRNA(Arg) A34 adenosine deaminase TadA
MAWIDEDWTWMQWAIALARAGNAEPGKNGIGCVIVRDGEVIGEGCNEVDLRHDATAHAEIVSMRRAGQRLQSQELRCVSNPRDRFNRWARRRPRLPDWSRCLETEHPHKVRQGEPQRRFPASSAPHRRT